MTSRRNEIAAAYPWLVWWSQRWGTRRPKQSRLSVFHYALNTTESAARPGGSVAYAVMCFGQPARLDPADLALAVARILDLDPSFFDGYPGGGEPAEIVRHAVRVFCNFGLPLDGEAEPLGAL